MIRFMKEQSQASEQQERDLTAEREYQRVTITGDEQCGVSQEYSLHGKLKLSYVFVCTYIC